MNVEKVREIIAESLHCDVEEVTMEARLVEDLEADSLDAVEMNMALEEELGFGISDEKLAEIKTVGDIVKFLEQNAQ